MNVNTITSSTIKTSYIPKKLDDKQEFKKILYKNSLSSKNILSININKRSTETLNKTKNSNKLKSKNENDGEKNTKKQSKQLLSTYNSAEITTDKSSQINQALQSLGNLVKSDVKNDLSEIVTLINQLKEKNATSQQVIDVAEKLTTKVSDLKKNLNLLKGTNEKNTKKQSKQFQSNGNVIDTYTDKSAQINQALQSLGDLVKSVQGISTTNNGTNKLNSNNLEQLAEVKKLAPETKGLIKNDISELVILINKLKEKNTTSPQVIDVAEKLTTKVADLKENLLKVTDERSTKKQSKQLLSTKNVIDTYTDKSDQINKVLQSLGDLVKSVQGASTTNNGTNKLNSNNLEQLTEVQKLEPDTKSIIKNNLSEIVTMINQLEVKNANSPQIIDILQRLTTQVNEIKGDLTVVKDNSNEKSIKQSIKTTSDIAQINQKQILSDNGGENKSMDNKSSDNKSFEEKFLNGLLGKDKDGTKISKAVTFMNQFENVKTVDISKVEVSNITINKNNFDVDVIKNIKYMETNSIKDLIVKMNPKELGEITIKLTIESGVMKASITAQNKDTYNLLNTNIQDISDRLKNMDIKIHSLDIGIYEDSTFFKKDSNGKNNNGTQNNNGGQNNNLKISMDSEEDISIINNNVIEENQINKFV